MSDRRGSPSLLAVLACVYGGLVAAAAAWLCLAGRGEALASAWIGARGVGATVAIGIGTALAISVVLFGVARYLPPFRRLDRALAELLGPLSERERIALAVASGLGEELFFRGALLEATGVVWSTLIFGALHLGPGILSLLITTALPIGWLFACMVERNEGLLAVALAHGTVNYLSLRRIARQ